MNDVEMLSMVGKGLVMGSADLALVDSLSEFERIGHCDEHSVSEYLAKLYAFKYLLFVRGA